MSKKTKQKRSTRRTRQSRRKAMRRFADITSYNIIKGVYEDATSLRSKGKRPNCPKAIKGFAVARRLAREPAEIELLERAATLIQKNCQDELEVYEMGLEEAERDVTPIGGGTGTIMLRTMPTSRETIDPLTSERVMMTAREAAQTGYRRGRDEKRAADEVRGTFEIVKPVRDVDGSIRKNPDGSPQMRVIKRDLSIRGIKRAINKKEIDEARGLELLHSYDKLNDLRRTIAEERRSGVDLTPTEKGPSRTTRGKYAKTFLYKGPRDRFPVETAEYAKLMRRRGEARTGIPLVVDAATLARMKKLFPGIKTAARESIAQSGSSVTEQLINLQTGQRLQREWNPKAKKWRQARPMAPKPLKGWW